MQQLRSHRAESSCPLLSPARSSPRPSQPYFNLLSRQAQDPSSPLDQSLDEIRYDSFSDSGADDSSREDSENDAHQRSSPSLVHIASESSESDSDDDSMTLDTLAESKSLKQTAEHKSDNQSQLTPRGRGQIRGRGRSRGRRGGLKALLARGAQGVEAEPAREGLNTAPRRRGRPPRGEGARGGGRGARRGPRTTADPSGEVKKLLSQANNAYIAENYDFALECAHQAIKTNPEIFAAHNLVSEIYHVQGDEERSLEVLFSAAHTRREPGIWWQVASRTGESHVMTDDAREDRLLYCYRRILQIDKGDIEARKRRLQIHMKRDHFGSAIRECHGMLKQRPNDLETLQLLAELCVESGEVRTAKIAYENTIKSLESSNPSGPGAAFTFSDLNIYLELFGHLRQYAEGLAALKSVARWICGRGDETFWNAYQSDDREWDIYDIPRRADVSQFRSGTHPSAAYGVGLPLEIRVKFGIYRLRLGPEHLEEAMQHFSLLEPDNDLTNAPMFDFPDMFRDVGNALFSSGYFSQALQFYEPLLESQKALGPSIQYRMAESYRRTSKPNLARLIYESLISESPDNPHYLIEIARTYEDMGDAAKALEYVTRVIRMGKRDVVRRSNLRTIPMAAEKPHRPAEEKRDSASSDSNEESDAQGHESDLEPYLSTRKSRRRRIYTSTKLTDETPLKRAQPDSQLTDIYQRMQSLLPTMRNGNEESMREWMENAETLLSDFTGMNLFFPNDRWVPFLGYTFSARQRALKIKPGEKSTDAEIMAERLAASLENDDAGDEAAAVAELNEIPEEYRGIRFEHWLDIFCELALCCAKAGQNSKAYEWIETAKDANVFYHHEKRNFHLHVVWFVCALVLEDEDGICRAVRACIKLYPGATDCYRLWAALHRLYPGEPNWYHSGPSQKFTLRQIKMIDFVVLDSDELRKRFSLTMIDRGGGASNNIARSSSNTQQDTTAKRADLSDVTSLDPAILVLYGHILATSGSYRNALNYYLRAYAVDTENTLAVLSISLAYLQLAVKRQAENRHYFIVQSLGFFDEYRRLRMAEATNASGWEQKNFETEVAYNEGRLWHYLGLNHLAIPSYERCLSNVEAEKTWKEQELVMTDSADDVEAEEHLREPNFAREAVYALQQIYATSGDMEKARELTEKWLVF